jgi:hypothetical protein
MSPRDMAHHYWKERPLEASRNRYRGQMLSAVAIGLLLLSLVPSLSSANDFRGRRVTITNYGSGARMGIRDPYVGPHASFEFVQSRIYSPASRFIQTGWSRQPACGNNSSVFVEVYNPDFYAGGFNNTCNLYFPQGDADYYQEYDGNTGYWCHGYQGYCIKSRYAATEVGFATASNLVVYGETNNQAAQMGGPNQNLAIWLTNVKYKPTSTVSSWNWATSSLGSVSYGNCSGACPYGYDWGYAANTLYTYNWTN